MNVVNRKKVFKFSQVLGVFVVFFMFATFLPINFIPVLKNIPWLNTGCSTFWFGIWKVCRVQSIAFIVSGLFFVIQCLITGLVLMSPEERAEANRNL